VCVCVKERKRERERGREGRRAESDSQLYFRVPLRHECSLNIVLVTNFKFFSTSIFTVRV